MKFNIKDRLALLTILPKEGNITTLKIVRKLREDLSFSEEEHKILNFRTMENGMTLWNEDPSVKKEIEVGEKATDVIIGTLKNLDKSNKLHEDHLSLWDLFIEADKCN